MISRMLWYGLLAGIAALAIMIYRHLADGEPIRMADLPVLIVAMPVAGVLIWMRIDLLRQVRREARERERDTGQP